jgi:DNA-binding transcriptional MerR regulator
MDMLGLKGSTFKKYCLELEKEGYSFQKDGRTRLFTNEDIKVLESFMELLKYDGITVSLAAKKVVEMKGKSDIPSQQQSYDPMSLLETAVALAVEERDKMYEVRMKEQEQQFALKMQEVLAQQLELQKKELTAKFQSELNKLAEPINRIEEHITKKKSWWKFR